MLFILYSLNKFPFLFIFSVKWIIVLPALIFTVAWDSEHNEVCNNLHFLDGLKSRLHITMKEEDFVFMEKNLILFTCLCCMVA